MFTVLVLLIAWPIAELFVIVKVAEAIGVLATLLLLIASWPAGAWVLRSRGRAAWRRLADAVAAGRNPGRHVLDGALVVGGGVLLMTPGFITDAIALCLLLPPSRLLLRRLLARNLGSGLVVRAARATRGRPAYDVDSTATTIDQPRLRR